jgi:hypothetical protein
VSTQSFDRYAVVKVFRRQVVTGPDKYRTIKSVDPNGTEFPSKFPNGKDGFRIRFKVDKVAAVTSPIPNAITIHIYNLGPDSRAIVSKTDNLLVLEAGYGFNARRIFTGSIMWGRTTKQGPDYVTEIQAADGLFAFQNARVDTSFQKGISINQVINTLVGALKPSGVGAGQITGVPSGGYNQGIVLTGSAVDRLREVCERSDLHFSIQDGNVLILPYGSDRGTPIPVYGPNTGLIGIPEVRTPDATGKATILSFKVLMDQNLGIFQKVGLQSKFLNGVYTTAKVTHEGDTYEGPWFSELECA